MTERLRRQRPCVIRMTTDLTSPRCGKPAVERREDNWLWVCEEHRLYGQTFTPDPGTDMRKRGRQRRPKPHELLGVPVMVTNPHTHDVWLGRGIALSDQPSILIEDDRGHRFMLPLEWARTRQS
ncbi:hypothetical protein SEA_FIREMAN_9 [Microbacterium phage Fireman]|uniref:Uncharacterized protein n=1 Tax=Microbacterium phage Fireman TaxID=2530118 RepID=A0A481VWL6_9CAUD|nr:hypothetical protein HOV22_gp10 [Microbacterium phage Fireman]QBI98093.1 hypothetical protein SEA_FIREMAN_9 [Microbacterium phage Fireman]